ncbi:MAG: hypothetical protein WCR52_24460 [Bacteroidota bacterium]
MLFERPKSDFKQGQTPALLFSGMPKGVKRAAIWKELAQGCLKITPLW